MKRLAALIEDLHGGADANSHKESDDEDGNGAAQHRLGGEQAPVRWLRDGLREAFDGI